MSEPNDKVFQMRVSETFLQRLDAWRRDQPGIPSRAETVRILVEKNLGPTKSEKKPNSVGKAARTFGPDGADTLREIANNTTALPAARKSARRVIAKFGIKDSEN